VAKLYQGLKRSKKKVKVGMRDGKSVYSERSFYENAEAQAEKGEPSFTFEESKTPGMNRMTSERKIEKVTNFFTDEEYVKVM
jgi:hypothetical protein